MLAELDRLGTVAAVSRALHLTAPAISMQLAALEREVGLNLTEKNGRGIALTPAGKLLAQHGHDIVDQLKLAEMEVSALRDGTVGTYRVAAFPSIARTIVAAAWAELAQTGDSGLRLELLELEPHESLPALAAGEVDLALAHSYSNMSGALPKGLESALLLTEPVWLAVPKSSTNEQSADLVQFASHNWIVPHRGLSCYEMVQRACGLAGFTPHVIAETSDFAVQLALVGAGAGVALIPQLTINVLPDTVQLLTLAAPVVRHDFVVARHTSAADAGYRTLRELFTKTAQQFSAVYRPL